ncbi:hypothetical protein Q668_16385 [Alcanivorax sp. PN-3]|nr:hypothetical protein Q668_16385 [Alcanivorax sp. PN-3]
MNMQQRAVAKPAGLWDIFRIPFWIGVISAVGLVSALLADGVWDALSWLCLAVPVIIALRPRRV